MIIWLFDNAGLLAVCAGIGIIACIPSLLAETRRKKTRQANLEYQVGKNRDELHTVREIITR